MFRWSIWHYDRVNGCANMQEIKRGYSLFVDEADLYHEIGRLQKEGWHIVRPVLPLITVLRKHICKIDFRLWGYRSRSLCNLS